MSRDSVESRARESSELVFNVHYKIVYCVSSLSFVRALFASQCEAEAHISDALRLIVVLYIYVCLKQLSQIYKGRKLGKVACRIQNTTSHSPSDRPGYCSKLCFFWRKKRRIKQCCCFAFIVLGTLFGSM